MKLFNYLLAICIMLLLSMTDTHAQKTETVKKDLSVELGGTYVFYNLHPMMRIDIGYGVYIKAEKIWDESFGFYASYTFTRTNEGDYQRTNIYGEETGWYNYHYILHTLSFGANWYIISSDIANKFTPYLGTSLLMTYSYDAESPTQIGQETVSESYGTLNFAFAPAVGLNIPVSSDLGIRMEGRYIFSLFDIVVERNIKRDWDYLSVNLGLKYSF